MNNPWTLQAAQMGPELVLLTKICLVVVFAVAIHAAWAGWREPFFGGLVNAVLFVLVRVSLALVGLFLATALVSCFLFLWV